ncbi:MAG: PQQ-binding-like beta-propeller repeat protein [Thermoanaerobaculia bacterium]|nr:PQQ-binding-like beta-propeller repeat protein [Thermoanaerobaculia bacterium]
MRQAIVFSGTVVLGLAPADGSLLWLRGWRTSYDVNAATPIFLPPNRLFVSSGYDTGAEVFQLAVGPRSVTVKDVWSSREMKNQFSSSVHLDGTIYGFNNRNLQAIDAATGEVRWRKGGFGHGSLLAADGRLIVLGDAGQLVLAEANPKRFVEQAAAQPLTGKHWTVPTLYGGRLYLRNESELVCLKIAG